MNNNRAASARMQITKTMLGPAPAGVALRDVRWTCHRRHTSAFHRKAAGENAL